ncbi:MAG TPA: hypothetical protein VIC58_01555 [Actinomycetota bacterium]|jgi:hypothetical protein
MFGWTYLDGTGDEVGRSHGFPDADAAEDWIGSSWQDLFENGVEAVVLFDLDRGQRVYRMGLGTE